MGPVAQTSLGCGLGWRPEKIIPIKFYADLEPIHPCDPYINRWIAEPSITNVFGQCFYCRGCCMFRLIDKTSRYRLYNIQKYVTVACWWLGNKMQHVAPSTIKMWSKYSCDWRYHPLNSVRTRNMSDILGLSLLGKKIYSYFLSIHVCTPSQQISRFWSKVSERFAFAVSSDMKDSFSLLKSCNERWCWRAE